MQCLSLVIPVPLVEANLRRPSLSMGLWRFPDRPQLPHLEELGHRYLRPDAPRFQLLEEGFWVQYQLGGVNPGW